MDVITYPSDRRPASWRAPVLALGNFDGLHRGHMCIINGAVEAARQGDRTPVLLTFDPHPREIIRPDQPPRLLMTTAGKIEALAESGLTGVAVVTFTAEVAQWDPEAFVRTVIVDWLGASEVWVGGNFLFGHDRTGDVEALGMLGRRYGFVAANVEPVLHHGVPVSSTRIRGLVAEGHVEEAAELLGRFHSIDGVVSRGDGRGRKIGYPTANLDVGDQLVPSPGVYATTARIQGRTWPAVTNLGYHPTFGASAGVLVETHLLDGGRELYGQTVRLGFVSRLRDERAFATVAALQQAISDDCERARAVFRAISV
ncbi:MAG: bifunctional riboflavin kinase/FAD synthetase [Acidobacteriota bacterium]